MTETPTNQKGGSLTWIVVIIILVVLGGGGYYLLTKDGGSVSGATTQAIDSSKYQAVFLTNGQVYFGKAANANDQYVALSDVYYLILKRPLQNQQKEGEEAQEQAKPEYSLVKLGKEMHGPTSMSINRDQVLFIENLADDSKVVSAIKNSGEEVK